MADERSTNVLVEQFRRGGIARDLRLMAAEGLLPLKAHDLIELWTHLAHDPDETVRLAANESLMTFPAEELLPVVKSPDTPVEVLSWTATHRPEPELREAALQNISLPDETTETRTPRPTQASRPPRTHCVGEAGADLAPAFTSLDKALGHYLSEEERQQAEQVTAVRKLYRLSTAERLIRALKGSREERAILVRDPNRLVAISVLASPRVTEAEIEWFSGMKNVSSQVLLAIAGQREWTTRYTVVRNLLHNPRTPTDIALTLVPRLKSRSMDGSSGAGPDDLENLEIFASEERELLMRLGGLIVRAKCSLREAEIRLGLEEREHIRHVIECAHAALGSGDFDEIRACVEQMVGVVDLLEQAGGGS